MPHDCMTCSATSAAPSPQAAAGRRSGERIGGRSPAEGQEARWGRCSGRGGVSGVGRREGEGEVDVGEKRERGGRWDAFPSHPRRIPIASPIRPLTRLSPFPRHPSPFPRPLPPPPPHLPLTRAAQPQPQLDTIPAQLPAQIPETLPNAATLLDPVPIDIPSASDQPSLSTSSPLSASPGGPADSPADELAGLTQRVAKSVRDVRGYAKLNISTATVQQVSHATLLDPVPIDVPSASDQPSLSTSSPLSASPGGPADSPADDLAGLTQRVAKSVRDVRGYAKLNVSTATVQQVRGGDFWLTHKSRAGPRADSPADDLAGLTQRVAKSVRDVRGYAKLNISTATVQQVSDKVQQEDHDLAGLSQRVAKSVRDVRGYAKLNVSTATVQQVCEMVDHSLAPWTRIPQIRDGMGAAGMVAPSLIKTISQRPRFMSCAGHVRVVDGSVYFRLGKFITIPYRVRRFLQIVQTIQRAVDFYNLAAVRAEFFVNTCDLPISYDSDVGGSRPVGFPFFCTRVVPGSVDVAIPDPLDLLDNMDLPENVEVPWEEKENRAVFRGAASSFPFEDSQNWRAHPLIRLHRMAEARPDLLDVKLIGWSIAGDVRKRMEADGVAMVGRTSLTSDPPMSKFKYQIVSGLPSSHQTCAILARGEQVAIRQASPYAEFFTPLLKPYVNFIPANRHFDNLIEKLRWAQSHDNHVHHMVAAGKRAAKWACTRGGHTLYWAILLIKYSKNALQDPSTIKAPVKTLCQDPLDPALLEMAGLAAASSPTSSPSLSLPDSWPPVCSRDNIDRSAQPKCVYYCQKGVIPGKSFVWVSAEALKAGGGAQSA
ncbi:unnamed protein product [Closterium sp. Naga37s-1]|nr:unnamed protein product [Closterium sp. Naga37s-1]